MRDIRTFMRRSSYIFITFCLFLQGDLLFSEKAGDEKNNDEKHYEFISHENSRTLAVIPLINETGEERVDYLRTGILKMMRSDLEEIGQILVEDPDVRFIARPYPHKKNRKSYKKGKSRLQLKLRMLSLNSDIDELYKMTDPVRQAEFLNADYILSGSIAGDPIGVIELNLQLFDARNMVSKSFRYEIHVQEIYKRLGPVAGDIKKEFASQELATITVTTSEPNALVYLDDIYLGRSPVTKKIFPDKYTLYVNQDGYESHEESVELSPGSTRSFSIQIKKIMSRGMLSVTSEPSGADVYLNITKIGQTPLVRDDLPEGTHRIRISKQGYIDRFIGVRITSKKSTSFSVALKEGDTYRHFRDPHYLILDWTYDEFAFASMISSLFFYGGYWSYRAESDRIRDSIRKEIPLMGVQNLPNLTLYEIYRLEKNNEKANAAMKNARASAAGGVFVLFLSGAFLWRGLVLEGRESGEVLNKQKYSFFVSPRMDLLYDRSMNSGMDFGIAARF